MLKLENNIGRLYKAFEKLLIQLQLNDACYNASRFALVAQLDRAFPGIAARGHSQASSLLAPPG